MEKRKRRISSSLIALFLLLTASMPISAETEPLSDDIVILYTNDVHTYIDGSLSYDVIAEIKDQLETEYKYVFLADAGDHIQGTAYGSMDKGETIIRLMNAAGYDVATLGNHEFDYGMDGCMNIIDLAEYPYISANFYHEENGVRMENVLDSYVLFDCGDEKLAFVGVTTPETFSKSTPAYFQDENGQFIYGIAGGEDGSALKQDVQAAIDAAKAEGATQIIGLGHLGIDLSSAPWTSEEVIGGVSGLDAFIDGHSHSIVEGSLVQDKDGNEVLLTQTGEYFNRIGMMIIDSDTGEITTSFIEDEVSSDDTVRALKEAWMQEIDAQLGQVIGSTELVFDNYDSEGNRLVRKQETNSGDFAADALYYLFDNMGMDVDVAIMNGGGVRNRTMTGEITYKTCKDMHTFGNVACLQTVTGQQILDALEWGVRLLGEGENGGFLQVSGLLYYVDPSVESTTQSDEMGTWAGGPTEGYRVLYAMVYNKETNGWEMLDLEAEYNLAGYNYTLRDLGDGFAMFDGAVNVLDYVMEDYMVLANYIMGFEGGVIEADNSPLLAKYPAMVLDYSDVNGSGRIEIAEPYDPAEETELWVGGVQVTEENMADVLGDGKVSFDPDTNTLTLTDADITNPAGHGIYAYGMNLTVHGIDTPAEGGNAISGTCVVEEGIDEDGYEYTEIYAGSGIYVEGNGYADNGSLTMTGTLGDIYVHIGDAITAYHDIIISGTVGNITANGDGLECGINSSFGNVLIEESGKVGDISAYYEGISASNHVTVNGTIGDITAGVTGISVSGGNVTINGKTGTITAGTEGMGGVGIEAYADIEYDDEWNEIGAIYGDVTINGQIEAIVGGVYGIYAEGNLMITDTTVDIHADEQYDEGAAIAVGGGIGTTSVIIAEPENHTLGAVFMWEDFEGEEVWYTTICIPGEEEDIPAHHVKYVPGYTVMFDAYPSPDYIEEQGIPVGGTAVKPADPVAEGYLFEGWFIDDEYTVEYDFNTPVDGDIVLYAKWTAAFVIGDIDGSGAVDIQDVFKLFAYGMLPETYPIDYVYEVDFNYDGTIDMKDALRLFRYSMLPEYYSLFE